MKIYLFFITYFFITSCSSTLSDLNQFVVGMSLRREKLPNSTYITGNDKFFKASMQESLSQNSSSYQVKYHNYLIIDSLLKIKNYKGLLTYVILPKNIIGQSKKSKKYKRYKKVLELTQELISIENKDINSILDTNLFVIMGNPMNTNKKVTVETYNYPLAQKVLSMITQKDAFKSSIFNDNDGPFLITTTKRFLEHDKGLSFLCVDLSTFNKSAIKEVFESYKTRLENLGNQDIGILEGLRYSILSTLTNFNDNIYIFKTAVAGELEYIER